MSLFFDPLLAYAYKETKHQPLMKIMFSLSLTALLERERERERERVRKREKDIM